ncbi:hypothetical protein AURDEDRAFT_177525 [Auricularia subglabra TFB-10046 SS5]|uniref:RNA-dependent RNA polymerase n=1 Tax=Auricularia subglabra (strain TFB-10046 / SS5) TaxID=717982 RepID=J0LAE7_AURST|nr:hypothetical protein AURDEDRAFT_177525 [Auricularia subglabra TFB-10046 SS5]
MGARRMPQHEDDLFDPLTNRPDHHDRDAMGGAVERRPSNSAVSDHDAGLSGSALAAPDSGCLPVYSDVPKLVSFNDDDDDDDDEFYNNLPPEAWDTFDAAIAAKMLGAAKADGKHLPAGVNISGPPSGPESATPEGIQGVHPNLADFSTPVRRAAAPLPPSSSPRSSVKRAWRDLDPTSSCPSSPSETPKRRRTEFGSTVAANGWPFYLAHDEDQFSAVSRLPYFIIWTWSMLSRDAEVQPSLPAEMGDLCGTNVAALKLLAESWKDSHPRQAKFLIKAVNGGVPAALDRENLEMQKDPCGCLGGRDPDGWYGGRVTFSTLLDLDQGSTEGVVATLNEPVLGSSMRFARRFGSDRLLRVHLTTRLRKNMGHEALVKLFERPWVMHSCVYRFLQLKDHSILMLRTDETLQDLDVSEDIFRPRRGGERPVEVGKRLTIDSFFEWYNPPGLNQHQAASKYFSRTDLMLSASVPGPTLSKDNILFERDEFSPGHGPKSPAEFCLTDGCGFANYALLDYCRKVLGEKSMPTGVQGRLAGFKGVFFRHPDEAKYRGSLDPQIWVRDSQVKVHHGAFDGNSGPQPDRAMLVFDILSFTRTSPGRLSAQFITNMSFNGVPTEVFERLLQDDMEHLVRSMTTWEGPNALPNLVHVLEVEGGLRNRRLAQLAGGEAKARGFRMRESDTRSGGSDRSEENGQPVVAVDTSGLSPIWEERCADLLKASFKPQDTAFLHRTLKEVIRSNLQRKVEVTFSLSFSRECRGC